MLPTMRCSAHRGSGARVGWALVCVARAMPSWLWSMVSQFGWDAASENHLLLVGIVGLRLDAAFQQTSNCRAIRSGALASGMLRPRIRSASWRYWRSTSAALS